MKKFIVMFALMLGFVSANAQTAIEKSNALDNIGIGITVGASTPLDFNSMFPVNTNVGLKITKDFSPIFGVQVEGLAFLNSNHFFDVKTAVKATNVGVNGTINLSNLLWGYKGTPRFFEVSTVAGLGWLHFWDTSHNFLSAKTGLDFAFNLGKKKAHSLVVTPAVYWNLDKFDHIHFSKNTAQLALNLTYIYHFKTSNGTHSFKTYDIGAMNNEINTLRAKLDECENRKPQVIEKIVEVNKVVDNRQWVVTFAKGSSELTSEAKATLNQIGNNLIVDIVGTASPEGSAEFNQVLSEKRADAVANFLTKNGVRVNSKVGKGAQIGQASNRLAIVTIVSK